MSINKDDLEFIASESDRPRNWYFSPLTNQYLSLNRNLRKVNNVLNGVNLPNPIDIKVALQKEALNSKTPKLDRTDADPITYKLWEHWQERNK